MTVTSPVSCVGWRVSGSCVDCQTLGFLLQCWGVCLVARENDPQSCNGGELVVMEQLCKQGVAGGGIDPVICIVVGDGVFWGSVIMGWYREWCVPQLVGDMSGNVLENFGGLCLPKETSGEIVKCVVPVHSDIWVHGRV